MEEKKDAAKLGRLRENPWIISTIVLAIVLIGSIFFFSFRGMSGNVVSEDTAANNLVSFINTQGQGVGEVKILSTEREGQLYKVTLDLAGQSVPVYLSMDGKYLITNLIPIDDALPLSDNSGMDNTAVREIDVSESPLKGDINAQVTIVEFSDYQCPFCERFYKETLPLIEQNYIKTGKARLFYKDFPLSSIHPEAQKAAEAARCVREQKGDEGYFKMHNKLFDNQQSLSLANYRKWAIELGVSAGKFDECLSQGKFAPAVLDDFNYGNQLGVSGTPAFFINGKLVSGAQPYSVFQQMIDAELAGA